MIRISGSVSNVNVFEECFPDASKKVEAALVNAFPNSKWDVQFTASVGEDDDGGSCRIYQRWLL